MCCTLRVILIRPLARSVSPHAIANTSERHLGHYWPRPVTITGGQEVNGLNIPKRQLVSRVQALLQTHRLKIAAHLPLADALQAELLAFRSKISVSGHDTYEAWRESDHDDLVLALALACWRRHRHSPPRLIRPGGRIEDPSMPQVIP